MTSIRTGGARAVRVAVGVVEVLLAVAIPALLAWVGVRVLAAELAARQPDGDLEAGGGFALAVLLVELVLAAYLVAAVVLAALWRHVARRPFAAPAVVALAAGAVVLVGVALSWG
jgi:hypothetical protein